MAEHPAFTLAGLSHAFQALLYRRRDLRCQLRLRRISPQKEQGLRCGARIGQQRHLAKSWCPENQAKSRPGIGLSVASALSTYSYQKKFKVFRFGV
ncbi:hypothetical protein DL762_005883 [Monosporascus cannonballus]|uniref:Uncharacterized protein n=1 Tax=Monosporascus cannonballus TaxID=155416 RepID=A0ABY0H3L1_9PEZI|nr:hypothetical protein DL763_010563 [Monosporascus cannonballus]RYO83981.1 hypothetical protein DL762_005883 [Monosporascus cannonballus]